jgi:monofunctional biosynthetic peptidoglycan transglycosylase
MLTIMIETLWPKERILEVYLNIVEFGRGIYGVRRPRSISFTRARRLTRAQSALLAVVLPNPRACASMRPRATCSRSATGS